jgi:DNA-binding NarL/FixJ family response regulator
MSYSITVAHADDHFLFRKGLQIALSKYPNFKIIYEAENGKELINYLDTSVPDLVFLDLQMPVLNGLDTLFIIKQKHPQLKVVVLSSEQNTSLIAKVMELGANCYLSKTANTDDIVFAINQVLENGVFLTQDVSSAILRNIKKTTKHDDEDNSLTLSSKEIAVLKLVCAEKNNKEIGELLNMSSRTVEAVRDRLRAKTNTKNTAGLIIYALKNNLIETEVEL